MIARLAKGVLPANTQIQKDALLAMHKSATVFVSYIASKYARPYPVPLHILPCFYECSPSFNTTFLLELRANMSLL